MTPAYGPQSKFSVNMPTEFNTEVTQDPTADNRHSALKFDVTDAHVLCPSAGIGCLQALGQIESQGEL